MTYITERMQQLAGITEASQEVEDAKYHGIGGNAFVRIQDKERYERNPEDKNIKHFVKRNGTYMTQDDWDHVDGLSGAVQSSNQLNKKKPKSARNTTKPFASHTSSSSGGTNTSKTTKKIIKPFDSHKDIHDKDQHKARQEKIIKAH